MTENASIHPEEAKGRLERRWFVRRIAYPVAVIVAIIAVVWWLENRDDDATSSSGLEYGVRDFPAGLIPPGADVAAEKGSYAPNFELETLDGGEARLADFRGRPIVLNFWATWCSPCKKEIPQFVDAYEQYRDDGLVIIGLNLQEGKSVIQPFAEEWGMEFPVLIDRDADVGDEYRLLGLPTTFFIDRDGVIVSIFTGPFVEADRGTNVQGAIEQGELEKRITEILGSEGDGGG